MNDGKLEYPDWQIPLQSLILEFDPQKLDKKIDDVEKLIVERLHELGPDDGDLRERRALSDAISIVRVIKEDRGRRPSRNPR